MTIQELYEVVRPWIPAVSTTSVLALTLFLLRTTFKSSIEGSVAHTFNSRIESLKSELKREEDSFKATLKSRDDEIAALRSGALSGLSFRQGELIKRRIAAAEAIWNCVVSLSTLKSATSLISALKVPTVLENSEKRNEDGEKLREFGEIIYNSYSMEETTNNVKKADIHRIFLTEITWALFAGYRQALLYNMLVITAIKGGLGKGIIDNNQFVLDILKSSLPYHVEYIDKYGIFSMSYLVDEFETKVFNALKSDIENVEVDNATVVQAANILQSVSKITDEKQAILMPEARSLEPTS